VSPARSLCERARLYSFIPRKSGYLPGRGRVVWRDWYTHAVVEGDPSSSSDGSTVVELDAPLGHIPVLIRSGAALLLHSRPGYTTRASAAASYALLVSLGREGHAHGTAVVDDGETQQQQQPDVTAETQSRTLTFDAHDKSLEILGQGAFRVIQTLGAITVLGVHKTPRRVRLDGVDVPPRKWVYDPAVQRLVVSDLSVDLNGRSTVTWS
jgi:alpha-glucosidase